MSYILDALRRAERERHAGKTPGVESLSYSIAASAARLPPAIWILALLTLAVAVAALLLALRQDPAPSPAAPASSVAPLATAAPSAPAAATVTAPDAPPATDATAAIRNGEALGSLDDVMTSDESVAEQDGATVIRARSRSAEDLAANSMPSSSPLQTHRVIKVDPTLPAALSPAATAASAADTPATDKAVRKLSEMPESYRAQFPQFNLEIHNYSSEPGRSWLMISGQRYKEGDSLPNGARVTRIVEDGVVYDYGGSQVLLPNR